jgi:ring-1,2-phenylacetyl-CoA epoxidase subunit PaaA
MGEVVPFMEEVGIDVPAHWDEAGQRWAIDCPFPRAFDEETKTWGEEITWDDVLVRWKARGPMNEQYVEKLQRGYRTTSFRRAG